jgi:hypothetical protein
MDKLLVYRNMDALLCGLLIFFYLFPFIAHSLATTCTRLRRVGARLSCVLQGYCHYWCVLGLRLVIIVIFLLAKDLMPPTNG